MQDADLVIGAVLIPGARAPKLITREMLPTMKPGSVLVDVAIDQGGCAETSKPTTHSDPTYVVDEVVHYCVANMPGAVPISSTKALTNVTLPYVEAIAKHGLAAAVARDPAWPRRQRPGRQGDVPGRRRGTRHGVLTARRRFAARACLVLRGCCGVLRPRRELHDEPGDAGRDRDDGGDVEGDAEEAEAVLIAFWDRHMPRACVIVLDGVGAGALPDAAEFGDEGSDTLGNVARAVGGLDLPAMEALGLGNVAPLEGVAPMPGAPAVAGRLLERSKGKDTTLGHWEMMGIVTPQPLPTYPHGFPHDVIDPFMHATARGVLGNKPASGTRDHPGARRGAPEDRQVDRLHVG